MSKPRFCLCKAADVILLAFQRSADPDSDKSQDLDLRNLRLTTLRRQLFKNSCSIVVATVEQVVIELDDERQGANSRFWRRCAVLPCLPDFAGGSAQRGDHLQLLPCKVQHGRFVSYHFKIKVLSLV